MSKQTLPRLQLLETRRKKALLYLRVSAPGQVNTDFNPEGISLPAQREAGTQLAQKLNADIIDEYIEPGRSATNTDARPKFQEMMARVKAEKDVDYIIVYNRARLFRNSVDAAIAKRDLRTLGISIASVMDYTEDTAIGDLVATVIDGVNEYQSRSQGADIAYKMGQKVKNGGTVARASIGYLNVRETFEGREVRTVAVDPDRGPLITMAFTLYASGRHTFDSLRETLTDAGLRTRPSKRFPAGTLLSIHRLGDLLRDRYYLGYVTHDGIEYKGRHQPLVTQEIFDQVQAILSARAAGASRERKHEHYLKGTVWCYRCKRRLTMNRARGRHGGVYFYFLCRGRQDHSCDLPHLPVHEVEDAVLGHYATVGLAPSISEEVRAMIHHVRQEQYDVSAGLRDRIRLEIARLEKQEDAYIELVGDPDWSKEKLAARMRAIHDERERLNRQLAQPEQSEVDAGTEAIEILLSLLDQPQALYRQAGRRARKILNQTFFTRLYVDAPTDTPQVVAEQHTDAVAQLRAACHHLDDQTPVLPDRGLSNHLLVDRTWQYPNRVCAAQGPIIMIDPVRSRTVAPRNLRQADGGELPQA